jgi:hypothetical protein
MPVTDQTPDVMLYDSNGVELAVANGVAIPVGTRGLLAAGSDGTNARFILLDASGRQLAVGAAASGAAVAGNPVLVAGSDGANARTLLTDATGKLIIGTTGATDVTSTGNLNALNVAVQVALAGLAGAGMQLSAGTLIGTLVAELSFDGGTTWVSTFFFDPTTDLTASSLVFSAANTATARSFFASSGASHVRVRVSAFTSGTASCQLRASAVENSTLTTLDSTNIKGTQFGTVTTAATTNVPIRASTYNEPAANAQRSISSANANDTAAGTGARQVRITYYTATFTGPFTEDVTLNGVAAVNTVATNICYIESIKVISVGSGGQNAGILTLFNATAGGGGTLATVNAGDNQTLWAQHYVATGKQCSVSIISGHNSNASNGTIVTLRSKSLGGTAPDIQISDFIRVGGRGGIQASRPRTVPLIVTGPARLLLYGAPEGTPSITTRASFDYYDQ